jgi:hypothetical protein
LSSVKWAYNDQHNGRKTHPQLPPQPDRARFRIPMTDRKKPGVAFWATVVVP